MNSCPFCEIEGRMVLDREGGCLVLRDGFPVTSGHLLIVPTRHVSTFRELTDEEWRAILALARRAAELLKRESPEITGFNFGFNDGAAAGQTIPHVHAHLIPRRKGDVVDPTGGIRGVIPGKARYG